MNEEIELGNSDLRGNPYEEFKKFVHENNLQLLGSRESNEEDWHTIYEFWIGVLLRQLEAQREEFYQTNPRRQ